MIQMFDSRLVHVGFVVDKMEQFFPSSSVFLSSSTLINHLMLYSLSTDIALNNHCGLVVRVSGYRSRVPGSIPGSIRFSEK
jgi:hypothetical protein